MGRVSQSEMVLCCCVSISRTEYAHERLRGGHHAGWDAEGGELSES